MEYLLDQKPKRRWRRSARTLLTLALVTLAINLCCFAYVQFSSEDWLQPKQNVAEEADWTMLFEDGPDSGPKPSPLAGAVRVNSRLR